MIQNQSDHTELEKPAFISRTKSLTLLRWLTQSAQAKVPKWRLLVFVLATLFVVAPGMWAVQRRGVAAIYTSSQSGSWASASTWGGAGVPGCADSVTINSGHTVTLDNTRCSANLTINGTLDLSGQQFQFRGENYSNAGTLTNSGALNNFFFSGVGGAGGTIQHIVSTTGSYSGAVVLHITNSTNVALDAPATISMPSTSQVSIDAGSTLTLNNLLTFIGSSPTATGFVNVSAGGTAGSAGLKTQGNVQITNTQTMSAPLEIAGSTLAHGTFGGLLTIDNGATLTLTNTLALVGNLQINNGGTLDLRGEQFWFYGNNYTNAGTLTNSSNLNSFYFLGVGHAGGTIQHITSSTGAYTGKVMLRIGNSTAVNLDAPATIAMPSTSQFYIDALSTLTLNNPLTFVGTDQTPTVFTNLSGTGTAGTAGLKTQGNVQIINTGNTFAPLEVESGMTQAHGTYSAMLTIDNTGNLKLINTLALNGPLRINSGGSLDLNGEQFTFQGLSYTNNGTLMNGGAFNNFFFNGLNGSGGTIQHIIGSTGSYAGAIRLHIANATSVTLDSAATISMPSTSDFVIDNLSTLDLPNLLTFNGTGPGFTNFTSNASPGLTGAAGMKTQGSVHIYGNVNFGVPLEVASGTTQSQGTFSAPLVIDSGATFKQTNTVVLSGNLTINGTLDLNGERFTFQGSNYANNGSLINLGPLNNFYFNGINGVGGTTQHIATSTGSYTGAIQVHIANSTLVALDSMATISMPSTSNFLIDAGSTLHLPNVLTFNGTGPGSTNFISNASPGVTGNAGMKTQGSVQIISNTSFSAPLEVDTGTTESYGTFSAPMVINGGATLKATNTLALSGNLTINGTLDLSGHQFTFHGANYANNGTLTNGSTFNSFIFNGVNGSGGTIQHITSSTGSYTGAVRLRIANSTMVNLDSAATIAMPKTCDVSIDAGSQLNLPNLLTLNGTDSDFTVLHNASASPGISGSAGLKTQGNVEISNHSVIGAPLNVAGGTTQAEGTFTGPITVDSGATLKLITTLASGDFTLNGTLNLNGSVFLFRGTTYNSQNGSLLGTGEFNFNGINAAGGTIQHISSGVTTFPTDVIQRISNSTMVVLDGDFQASLVIIDGGSTLNITNRKLSLAASGTPLFVNGSIITTGSTVEMNGTLAQTLQTSKITYQNLIINNSAGVTLPTATAVGPTLTLMNGAFTIGSNLTIASGGLIRRSNGSLNGTPVFGTGVNVEYFGANAVTTGNELPASSSVLGNLTINNPNIITLSAPRTVNGTLFLNTGTLSNATNLTIGNGGLIQRDTGTLGPTPTFSGSVEVSYVGTTGVTTGPEIPGSAGALTNLLINKSGGVTLGGNAVINGTLSLTNGVFSAGSNTLTINNSIAVGSGSLASGPSGTVVYGQSSDGQAVLPMNYGNLSFSNFNKVLASSGVIGVSGLFTPGSATGHVITGSTIAFNGGGPQTVPAFSYNNLTSSNAGSRILQSSGSIRIAGIFTPGSNPYTVTGSTVEYNGASAQTLPANFATYNNLMINNTAGVSGVGVSGLNVNGLLRVQAGTFTSGGSYNSIQVDSGAGLNLSGDVTVSGNWLNDGAFTANNHAVVFNGGSGQTISGNTTFYDFTKSPTAAQTMFFSSTGTQIVAHSLTLKGTAGNLLSLRSTVNGLQWHLRAPATLDVQFVDVKDSNASGGQTITATNSTDSGNNINWMIVPNDISAVQFTSATYSVLEGAGSVVVGVHRTGDTTGTASVQYATHDTAGVQNCNHKGNLGSAKCDYITAIGTLTFEANEASKTVTILTIDDSYNEGDETFTIDLSNPTRTTLGPPSTTTITILDNDPDDKPNPIDTAEFFANEHYFDFLNRIPDESGLAFWTGEITMCGSDVACIEVKRINVSAAFYLSIEFQQTGYLVERIYKSAYGDGKGMSTLGTPQPHEISIPIVRLEEFLPDTQEIGRGVVVLEPGWEQKLENNKKAFVSEFVQRPRFLAEYPTSMSPEAFVDKLNDKAGNCLLPNERNDLVDSLTTGAMTRAEVLRAVAENQTLTNAEFNRAFVLMQYFGYLRRNPNDPQDTDYTGYDFWLTKLDQFNGNYIKAEMVKAFISSIEYRQRFGP